MAKKVSIGAKPSGKSVEEWVNSRNEKPSSALEVEPVKTKRLTLDIPEPLHKAIKKRAADEGTAMVDMLRELLEKHYG